mmetsp:Transcript_20884/g.59173  ORF Transcript_20884/g.59173 Transcript_20884/m.59173 type:complete len:220 (-) Transcript_20884:372-1031(-)
MDFRVCSALLPDQTVTVSFGSSSSVMRSRRCFLGMLGERDALRPRLEERPAVAIPKRRAEPAEVGLASAAICCACCCWGCACVWVCCCCGGCAAREAGGCTANCRTGSGEGPVGVGEGPIEYRGPMALGATAPAGQTIVGGRATPTLLWPASGVEGVEAMECIGTEIVRPDATARTGAPRVILGVIMGVLGVENPMKRDESSWRKESPIALVGVDKPGT